MDPLTFQFTGVNGTCTATSYLPNGTVQAQANFAFPTTGATVNVQFPLAVAGPTNYITLACNLNSQGAILSLASLN